MVIRSKNQSGTVLAGQAPGGTASVKRKAAAVLKYAVRGRSRDYLQRSSSLLDEILNSVLFLLIGLNC